MYEVTGDIPNVVFHNGAVHVPERDALRVYYGAADTCVAVATARVADLLDWLRSQPAPAA